MQTNPSHLFFIVPAQLVYFCFCLWCSVRFYAYTDTNQFENFFFFVNCTFVLCAYDRQTYVFSFINNFCFLLCHFTDLLCSEADEDGVVHKKRFVDIINQTKEKNSIRIHRIKVTPKHEHSHGRRTYSQTPSFNVSLASQRGNIKNGTFFLYYLMHLFLVY